MMQKVGEGFDTLARNGSIYQRSLRSIWLIHDRYLLDYKSQFTSISIHKIRPKIEAEKIHASLLFALKY